MTVRRLTSRATYWASSFSSYASKRVMGKPASFSVQSSLSLRWVFCLMTPLGHLQDGLRGAVVLPQDDHFGVGVVALEVEDVADVGGAPTVD